MRLIFLGPPGSGKGTQARLLQKKVGVPQISTGDLLRDAIKKKTSLGLKAEGFIVAGKLVPDQMIVDLISEKIKANGLKGYILDGFPRTLPQAYALDQLLAGRKEVLDAVINFGIDDQEIIKRLTGRRVCQKCKEPYHLSFSPPKVKGVCDRCGGRLTQRLDDQEETIVKRLIIYRKETEPLIDYYKNKGLLREVKGVGEIGEIHQSVSHALGLK